MSDQYANLVAAPLPSIVAGAVFVTVILPDPVIGEPDTLIPVPAVIPTLVTVPLPVPAPISERTSVGVFSIILPDEFAIK